MAAGFAGARALAGIGEERGAAQRDHLQLAAVTQAAMEAVSPAKTPRISLSLIEPAAGRGQSQRENQRQLERRGTEPTAAQHHYDALRALRAACLPGAGNGKYLLRAEAELAAALKEKPESAAPWNDLAALYMTWARALERPRLYLDAFAATSVALEREPDFQEARLNQALILEELGLLQESAESGFPAIAGRPTERDPVSLHEKVLKSFQKAFEPGGGISFLETAKRFRPTAERWAYESLLPRWAERHAAGDAAGAEEALGFARDLGKELAHPENDGSRPDSMLWETVAAIDFAATDPYRLSSLIRGHQAYGRGMQAFPERLTAASGYFQEATIQLEKGDSPFAAWAKFYIGACRHIQRDLAGAMTEFDRLAEMGKEYPGLAVKLGWGRGLIFNHLNEIRSALDTYRPARMLAAELGDWESVAAIAYQEAEAAKEVGRHEDAWRSLVTALQIADEPVRARYRVNVLFTAADQALPRPELLSSLLPHLKPGYTELQNVFQKRAVQDAERSGLATFVAQSRSRWATLLEAKGSNAEAAVERRRAKTIVESIVDDELRRRAQAELALGQSGDLFAVSDELLLSSLETFRQQKLIYRALDMAIALANRARLRGEADAAERWLEEAQRMIEVLAIGLEPVQDRFRYLAALQWVARTRIASALERSDDAWPALEIYLREQTLLRQAMVTGGGAEGGKLQSPASASALPPGKVYMAWLALPDGQLVVLALSAAGARVVRLSTNARELSGIVAELRSHLEVQRRPADGRSAEVDASIEDLSRQLIAPIADLLPPEGGMLGISLDDVFAGIPFEALSAAPGEPRLVERFLLARVAGPEVLVNEPTELSVLSQGGLVIGASRPAPTWGLELLEAVPSEIAAIRNSLRLSDDQVLEAAESTYTNVRARLNSARWLHFAGHALPHPYAGSSSILILAEDGINPTSVSIEELATESRDHLELAVLAGCETARSGTGGLAQSLERGGVPVVIGSHWPVSDQPTAKFFSQFYQLLAADVPPIQAFHQTQLTALRSNDPQLASVASWGSFAAWGW